MRPFLALLLTITLPLIAADPQWERLKSLRPGERIWIDYMRGDKLQSAKAEASAWTEDSLAVRIKNSEVVLARGDVRKVAVYGGKSRAKGAGIGALIGAGVGAGISLSGGMLASGSGELGAEAAAVVAGFSMFCAGVGALIGLAAGSTKKVTVYEAPKK